MRFAERIGLILVLVLGLGSRLLMVSRFPTIPISDFANLISFARHFQTLGYTAPAPWFWSGFSPGMPLALSLLFYCFPCFDPSSLARLATAAVTGCMALLPFLLWRGILPWRIRVLAGILLALWPGQILYSGVVAQDNWILLPTVAMASLAVRALFAPERAMPITAGVIYALAVGTRADTMLTLLPLLLAALRVDRFRVNRKEMLAGAAAAILVLCVFASQRYAADGRFSVTPLHGGVSTLGAYLPGSAGAAWVPPYAFIASVHPEILRDRMTLYKGAWGLVGPEAFRRPWFHLARVIAMLSAISVTGDAQNMRSSLQDGGVLPEATRERGGMLAASLAPWLRIELALIQALFLAALLIGVRLRHPAVLLLSFAVVLKYVYHAFGVILGRYLIVATAMELLTIALAIYLILETPAPQRRKLLSFSLSAGAAAGLLLFFLAPAMLASVEKRDVAEIRQLNYRFWLKVPRGRDLLECTMSQGRLELLWPDVEATIGTLRPNPSTGDKAIASCELIGSGDAKPAGLEIQDRYTGSEAGHILQEVWVDGVRVYANDIGAGAFSGWSTIPLGLTPAGARRKVEIQVATTGGQTNANWGEIGLTTFHLVESPPQENLALNKPSSQSSHLGAAISRLAVDGNIDGGFFAGSVTHTADEKSPWWEVDLGTAVDVGSIVIRNRTDCCAERLSNFWVFVSEAPFAPTDTPETLQHRPGTWSSHQTSAPVPSLILTPKALRGRYFRVQLSGQGILSLAEVEILRATPGR